MPVVARAAQQGQKLRLLRQSINIADQVTHFISDDRIFVREAGKPLEVPGYDASGPIKAFSCGQDFALYKAKMPYPLLCAVLLTDRLVLLRFARQSSRAKQVCTTIKVADTLRIDTEQLNSYSLSTLTIPPRKGLPAWETTYIFSVLDAGNLKSWAWRSNFQSLPSNGLPQKIESINSLSLSNGSQMLALVDGDNRISLYETYFERSRSELILKHYKQRSFTSSLSDKPQFLQLMENANADYNGAVIVVGTTASFEVLNVKNASPRYHLQNSTILLGVAENITGYIVASAESSRGGHVLNFADTREGPLLLDVASAWCEQSF